MWIWLAFLNTTVDKKLGTFPKTVFNIVSNFYSTWNNFMELKNLPWFNNKMRKLSKEKNTAFSRYYNNSSDLELKRHLKFLQENLNTSIESSKQRYYSRMVYQLYNMQRNSRSYWSLMKIFLSNKEIPLIPLYTMRIVV